MHSVSILKSVKTLNTLVKVTSPHSMVTKKSKITNNKCSRFECPHCNTPSSFGFISLSLEPGGGGVGALELISHALDV